MVSLSLILYLLFYLNLLKEKTKVLEKLKRGMTSDLDDMHRRQIQLRGKFNIHLVTTILSLIIIIVIINKSHLNFNSDR